SGIAILNYYEISKGDLGSGADLQHASVRGNSGRPVTHEKVIVAGVESDFTVVRIEGQGALEAGHRFAPTPLPAIDACNVNVDLGVIGRSRRGDLEFLKSCVVLLIPPIEAKTQSHVRFA